MFHIPQEAVKMEFPFSYIVYTENYHVGLPITTRTNQSGEYNR